MRFDTAHLIQITKNQAWKATDNATKSLVVDEVHVAVTDIILGLSNNLFETTFQEILVTARTAKL